MPSTAVTLQKEDRTKTRNWLTLSAISWVIRPPGDRCNQDNDDSLSQRQRQLQLQ